MRPSASVHPGAGRVANHIGGTGGHQEVHPLRGQGGFAQRRAQQPVFDHDAERVFARAGIESDAAGLEAVADPDRADRAGDRRRAARRPPIASSIRHDELATRGGAAVVARRDLLCGIGGVDHDCLEAVPVERDRERQPDQAAAEDDDVAALHFLP